MLLKCKLVFCGFCLHHYTRKYILCWLYHHHDIVRTETLLTFFSFSRRLLRVAAVGCTGLRAAVALVANPPIRANYCCFFSDTQTVKRSQLDYDSPNAQLQPSMHKPAIVSSGSRMCSAFFTLHEHIKSDQRFITTCSW